MYRSMLKPIRNLYRQGRLPAAAKTERRNDRMGLPVDDPGIDRVIRGSIAWLGRAQDHSASCDGGVAYHFSLAKGWGSSYPETTGYIIPTMLAYAKSCGDESARQRARRMLDWLISIQLPDGSFQGGKIGANPLVPVAFNTGQILLGLASGVVEFGEEYHEALCRAADWLAEIQDPDGCWRKHSSPFAIEGERAYDTHLAWGLLEAARIEPEKPYAEAALANVRWALLSQQDNGWFDKCCLTDFRQPLTHTLGYVLRGILEAYRFTSDPILLHSCQKTADGLLTAVRENGFLPGRLDSNWRGTVPWVCLTGTVQIAYCWLMLYRYTGDARYRDGACAANKYVRRTVKIEGPLETRGAVKGAFPIDGDYQRYGYPNWACKFFIDANLLEQEIRRESKSVMQAAQFQLQS